jgi:hypothetical protein
VTGHEKAGADNGTQQAEFQGVEHVEISLVFFIRGGEDDIIPVARCT